MKNSDKILKLLSILIPKFLKYSAKLVSATLKPLLLPEEVGVTTEKSYKFLIYFSIYIVGIFSILIMQMLFKIDYILLPLLVIIEIYVAFRLRSFLSNKIKKIEEQIDYHLIHHGPYNLDYIIRFISNLFLALLIIIALGTAFWNYGYFILASLLIGFVLYLIFISYYIYRVSMNNKL